MFKYLKHHVFNENFIFSLFGEGVCRLVWIFGDVRDWSSRVRGTKLIPLFLLTGDFFKLLYLMYTGD